MGQESLPSTSGQWPKSGWLHTDGWAGVQEVQVLVVGETPKRWRIKCLTTTKLAGRNRWAEPGQVVLVPKYAVTDVAIRRLP